MSATEIAAGMFSLDDASVLYALDFSDEDVITNIKEGGDVFWGYGGDWDDKLINDKNFVGNGLIPADRSYSPKLAEAKKVHQEISFYDDGKVEQGQFRIVNEFPCTNLNEYAFAWTLKQNNNEIATGTFDVELAAASSKTITLTDFPEIGEINEGDEYFLVFEATQKYDRNYAPAGHVVASEQFQLDFEEKDNAPVLDSGAMNAFEYVSNSDDIIEVTGKDGDNDFTIQIDKTTGYIAEYTYGVMH